MASSHHRIELRVVCSAQIKKESSAVSENGYALWVVEATKPFGDDANLGKLHRQLGINAALELKHYHEGAAGDVIDLRRTPEELAYRPRMSVYLQLKASRDKEQTAVLKAGELTLSEQEYKLLKKLQIAVMPNLNPDDPCPLCSRTVNTSDGGQGDVDGDGAYQFSGARNANLDRTTGMNISDFVIGRRTHCEVGVQVGNAGRVTDPISVSFGTASRLRDGHIDSYASYGSQSYSGGVGGRFFDADDGISELKRQLDEAVRRGDEIERRLRESEGRCKRLEKDRLEHKCEVSSEVAAIKEQNERLNEALRDMMRGREEVVHALIERRTAGSMITDTPRPYAPLRTGAPALDGSPHMSAKELMMSQSDIGKSIAHARGLLDRTFQREDDPEPMPELLRRPSGAPAESPGRNANRAFDNSGSKAGAATLHTPGQCLLRVASVSGDPFFVKRRMTSSLRAGGEHVFTLLSLDGVVTDEIFADEIVTCATDGPTGLALGTRRNSWVLYMSPSDRTQWLHWFYALNPFLSASRGDASGIPNSF